MINHLEPFSNVELSSLTSQSNGNNDLLIAGYNSLLANDDAIAAKDFYLLLIVYVN